MKLKTKIERDIRKGVVKKVKALSISDLIDLLYCIESEYGIYDDQQDVFRIVYKWLLEKGRTNK